VGNVGKVSKLSGLESEGLVGRGKEEGQFWRKEGREKKTLVRE